MLPRRVWIPADWELVYGPGSRWGTWVKMRDGYYLEESIELDPRLIHDAVLPKSSRITT